MSQNFPPNQVNVSRLPKEGETITLSADGVILDTLSANTAAQEVLAFEAEISIKRWKQAGAVLSGNIKTHIAQECVATLAPMETKLDINFERFFLPSGDPLFASETMMDGELLVEPEGEDMPDILEGNAIDIWEVVLEELNLQIDPFPRKSEFAWQGNAREEANVDEETRKPFANLKELISKKNPH